MAAEIKTVLAGITLVQKGKVVATPEQDNYAVYPVAGSPLSMISGQEVIKVLKNAFPKCVFTWRAKPFAAPAKDEKPQNEKSSGKDK